MLEAANIAQVISASQHCIDTTGNPVMNPHCYGNIVHLTPAVVNCRATGVNCLCFNSKHSLTQCSEQDATKRAHNEIGIWKLWLHCCQVQTDQAWCWRQP